MRRWVVWLGALALALGGVFLVKYSIDQGFFGPVARVVAGIVLGLAATALSEPLRRRPPAAKALGPVPQDYVAPALAAAGIVILFASTYAAYGLYQLLPSTVAFLLLAAISLGGATLALLHGRFLALLGLAGAYVVPLLVATEHPSVPPLLAYVLVVTGGCLLLVHWRDWAWLGWVAVAGSGLWTVVALLVAQRGDTAAIGLYLVVLAALFPAAGLSASIGRHRRAVAWSGAGVAALLMLLLVLWAEGDGTSLGFAWALTALYAAIGVRQPLFDRLPWIAALLQVLVLAGWVFSGEVGGRERLGLLLLLPPSSALGSYLAAAALIALLAGAGGFAMSTRAPRPDRWALLSEATPLGVLVAVYWRVTQLAASLPWAGAALLLAIALLVAAEQVARQSVRPGYTNALAYYALGVTGAVALALTLSLRLGWLSVALSLELPAIAWLHERTGARILRGAALALAAAVAVRLLLNPAVADYALGSWPIFNGLLYTYGIPAAAFAATALWLRRSGDDLTVRLLEVGALALGVAFVTLEIRHLVGGGRIDADAYGLLEQALQTDAWLVIAYALLTRSDASGRPLALAWRFIAGIATGHFVLLPCLRSNPLLVHEHVGEVPVLDVLLLAYAVPAALALLYHRAFRTRGAAVLSRIAGIAAVAIAFLYLSLEVRHLFQGGSLDRGGVSDGEWYAYSAAWLAYGAALLAIGIVARDVRLRLAGLVVGAVVAVKAFGFDMAALTGLYRAASFLGLGISLFGIAWLYQRIGAAASQS